MIFLATAQAGELKGDLLINPVDLDVGFGQLSTGAVGYVTDTEYKKEGKYIVRT